MEYSQKLFGLRVSKYRQINNLTQKQLSEKCKISSSYLASIETGVGQTISLEKAYNIAEALHVSLDNLVCDSLIKLSNSEDNNPWKSKILDEISTFNDKQVIEFYNLVYAFLDYKKENGKA